MCRLTHVCSTCMSRTANAYTVSHGTGRISARSLYLQRIRCSDTYCRWPSGVTGGCVRAPYHCGWPHASEQMTPKSTKSTT